MSRLHSTLVALVLGAATAAGLFAAVQTVQLGQKVSAPKTVALAPRDLAFRQAKLDRWSKSLRRQRAKRPPALPKLPKFAPVPHAAPAPAQAAPAAPTAAAPVRYVRARAVVKYRHGSPPPASTTSSQPSRSDDGASDVEEGTDDGGSTGGGD